MPTDACQFFYVCKGCGEKLKPLPGRLPVCLFLWIGAVPTVQESGKDACCR